jgi:hypothetical protein
MKITVRYLTAAAGIVFLAFTPGLAWANSKFLNVQGKLTDAAGNPLTGSQTVTFRLYTSSISGSTAWTESQSVSLSTGLFNVTLGSTTSLDSLAFNQVYYLGIQVAGDANELTPRQQLGAAAYALGSLGSFSVGNDLAVGSSITANAASLSNLTASAATLSSLAASTITVSGNIGISGNQTVGGQSVIAGTSTVHGNAFSVGGATFSIAGGSITLGGRLNAAAAGIKWADGTTSTTTAIGNVVLTATQTLSGSNTFTSEVTFSSTPVFAGPMRSTYTILGLSYSPTNTTFTTSSCLSGSTVTLTTKGGPVEVYIWLVTVPNGGNPYFMTYLMDSTWPSDPLNRFDPTGGNNSRALATCWQNGGSSYDPCILRWITQPPAGQHSFCIAVAVNGGTGIIPCNALRCQIQVTEL